MREEYTEIPQLSNKRDPALLTTYKLPKFVRKEERISDTSQDSIKEQELNSALLIHFKVM
jgi:hypothetical protein